MIFVYPKIIMKEGVKMITVSVRQLVEAIKEADDYRLPDMNEGTSYLYNKLYKRLSYGEDVRLSHINWSSFELDDVDTIRGLYSDVLEANESRADTITRTLRGVPPVVTAAAFV